MRIVNAQEQMKVRIEKLSLGPKDLIIVRTEEDMATLQEMCLQGVGFSEYANPVLLIKGGLEKATEADLLDALKILRGHTEAANLVITAVN